MRADDVGVLRDSSEEARMSARVEDTVDLRGEAFQRIKASSVACAREQLATAAVIVCRNLLSGIGIR